MLTDLHKEPRGIRGVGRMVSVFKRKAAAALSQKGDP